MNLTRDVSTRTPIAPNAPPSVPRVIPNVRIAEALARFAGDEERYRHWLLEFVGHGPSSVRQIRQAITNGSVDTAINLVHGLFPVAQARVFGQRVDHILQHETGLLHRRR